MNDRQRRAQDELKSSLVDLLGPTLPGVTSFGVRWDDAVAGPALGVFLEQRAKIDEVRSALPEKIDDLPVRVSQRNASKLGG